MSRSIRVPICAWTLVLNLVAASPYATPRSAVTPTTITNPAISFATGYAHPSRYWGVGGPLPWINDTMTILGKVAAFQAPFDDLDATDPGVEFTYRIRDLSVIEVTIWDDFARNEGGLGVRFENGLLEIYRDSSPEADFAHPSTFVDGEMILTASISHMSLILYSSQSPPQESFLRFTGGTLFDRVQPGGSGLRGPEPRRFRRGNTGRIESARLQRDVSRVDRHQRRRRGRIFNVGRDQGPHSRNKVRSRAGFAPPVTACILPGPAASNRTGECRG